MRYLLAFLLFTSVACVANADTIILTDSASLLVYTIPDGTYYFICPATISPYAYDPCSATGDPSLEGIFALNYTSGGIEDFTSIQTGIEWMIVDPPSSFTIASVSTPEPSTFVLMGLGIIFILSIYRTYKARQ
jgi:hypothetical protein